MLSSVSSSSIFFFLGWVVAAVTGRTKCDTVIRPWKGGVGSPAAEDLKHRRYRPYHHYFDHHTFIKCYGKFISFWKTELISDNTPQPGVCSSSLWDELAAICWSPSRYVDGAKKAIDDSTDKLIMNCVLPLCWRLGGNKQRCENEACYQVDSPCLETNKRIPLSC